MIFPWIYRRAGQRRFLNGKVIGRRWLSDSRSPRRKDASKYLGCSGHHEKEVSIWCGTASLLVPVRGNSALIIVLCLEM